MRIAIISDVYSGYISGVATFAKRLSVHLSMNIEKVIVITAGDRFKVVEDGNLKIIYFKGLFHKKFKDLFIGFYSLNKIKDILIKEKIDLVHVQLPTLLGMASTFYARKRKIPVIFSSHLQPENILFNVNIKSNFLKKLVYNFGFLLFSFCDHLVCPSSHAVKELLQYGIRKSTKMSVISNGINTKWFKPSENGKSDSTVLFVGRVMPEKCIDTLIKASAIVNKYHPEYKFVIGGTGYYMEELRKLADKINPGVIFTDRLSDEELLELIQSCYLFVLPSETELQGIALLEAMSCAKPTIASDSEASAAGELSNVLFKHKDHKELAEKIMFLIKNKDVAKEYSKSNRNVALKEHDYSIITKKYIKLYDSYINQNN